MPGRLQFRPRWWGAALAAAGCLAGVMLGNWQSGRADEKRAAAAATDRITVQGEFLPRFTVLLDNKLHQGRAGYHVVQPLRLAGGDRHLLVNRGWIAARERRDLLPEIRTPAGTVALQGLRRARLPRAYEPAAPPLRGLVRQNLSVEEMAAWSGLVFEPHVLEQHSELADGLTRAWPRAEAGIDKHESYALQWYSLAALSVILFLALSLRRHAPPAG